MEEEWPIMTFILITINLAIFLFFNSLSQVVISNFGLSPDLITTRPYTLITHMFIHGDVIHLTSNMVMLGILGLMIENKIGSVKFLFIYIFSGLCAIPFALLIEFITGVSATLIGTSAAIFGLMFIGGLIAGTEKVPMINLHLLVVIILFLLLNFALLILNAPISISEFAHFGGFIGGFIGFLLILTKKR
ncbi:MAG: rhomboid family intramembrane serine protease [Candidatus Aenigmatarchaeota archaeon]